MNSRAELSHVTGPTKVTSPHTTDVVLGLVVGSTDRKELEVETVVEGHVSECTGAGAPWSWERNPPQLGTQPGKIPSSNPPKIYCRASCRRLQAARSCAS